MMIMSHQNNNTETGTESVSEDCHQHQRRLCDFCGEATAVLYCRADSAKLCLACDRQVHYSNPLFAKHTRWLLCDSCDSTPATIFCCTHAAVLCQNCDWDAHQTHNNNTGQHDRRPLEGFSGRPSASELLGILGFDADAAGKKAAAPVGAGNDSNTNSGKDGGENVYGFSDFLVWETPSMVSLDDLIMPPQGGGDDDCSSGGGGGHSFQAMGVPPLPKNRNATCGQHKEEILFQIHEISKLEPNLNGEQIEAEPCIGFQFLETDQLAQQSKKQAENLDNLEQPTLALSNEANSVGWFSDKVDVGNQDFPAVLFGSYVETSNAVVPDKVSEAGDSSGQMNDSHEDCVHPPGIGTDSGTGNFQVLPRFSVRELNSQERDSAISRYKEKKKTRRYDKHIRYETRKARAESRARIRGRFAKIER